MCVYWIEKKSFESINQLKLSSTNSSSHLYLHWQQSCREMISTRTQRNTCSFRWSKSEKIRPNLTMERKCFGSRMKRTVTSWETLLKRREIRLLWIFLEEKRYVIHRIVWSREFYCFPDVYITKTYTEFHFSSNNNRKLWRRICCNNWILQNTKNVRICPTWHTWTMPLSFTISRRDTSPNWSTYVFLCNAWLAEHVLNNCSSFTDILWTFLCRYQSLQKVSHLHPSCHQHVQGKETNWSPSSHLCHLWWSLLWHVDKWVKYFFLFLLHCLFLVI